MELIPIDPSADRAHLIAFLSTNRFPFHVVDNVSEAEAASRIERGGFTSPGNVAYWISSTGHQRMGYVVFEDLDDGAPLIDLRLAEMRRGKSIGTQALTLATALIFRSYPNINRIEGNTRVDNSAMRRVFEKCGYAKEAHYREGWTVPGGSAVASVAYAILRSDWMTGTVTLVPWQD